MRDLQFQPKSAGVNLLLPYLWADSYEDGAPPSSTPSTTGTP